MVSDAADGTDGRSDAADEAGARPDAAAPTPSLVDRWTALDRGWQALALGLGIVAAHLIGQAL
ncbi:hypothetical protein C463_10385 [Halorubrum californiense DSM 19288]|uniref:Uncharacterized protein n=1 Tax=Halorubrum californiense DSM 19288 TaxID=1227465 RepID=M0E7P4_9EURY|nr:MULTISPECIES: hypothetical protein [Halorubrum]ELZ43003.1 hypothetical protein C463_10385 [Halorubrum californiense DSM 19288]TKX71285.1 hypothetical protein EXE40_08070 [Halorubrum sp. GN11GM_10-3_MGM]